MTPNSILRPVPRRTADRGFSLVECLVALAIFAFMMLGTIPLFIRSTRDISRNRNMLHYNNGMQALLDELTTRNSIISTDPIVNGQHIYTNATCNGTAPTPCGGGVPTSVNHLFSGIATSNRVQQNNLLAQVQYDIVNDGSGRTRADIMVYYYTSANAVKPVSGTAWLTPAAARGLRMSPIVASGYIDTPATPGG